MSTMASVPETMRIALRPSSLPTSAVSMRARASVWVDSDHEPPPPWLTLEVFCWTVCWPIASETAFWVFSDLPPR